MKRGLQPRLLAALKGQRIQNTDQATLATRLSHCLGQTYVVAGFRLPDAKDLGLLTAKLALDLAEQAPRLTMEEISICFELGAKGEYGDYMGINLRTLTRWLKAYRGSDARYQAVVEQEKQRIAPALPPVSEAYKEERERLFLNRTYTQYRDGYPLERLLTTQVYRVLQRRGMLRHTPAEKWEAMRRFERWRPAGNLPIREDDRREMIRMQAMRWLLKAYFDRLIADGAPSLPFPQGPAPTPTPSPTSPPTPPPMPTPPDTNRTSPGHQPAINQPPSGHHPATPGHRPDIFRVPTGYSPQYPDTPKTSHGRPPDASRTPPGKNTLPP